MTIVSNIRNNSKKYFLIETGLKNYGNERYAKILPINNSWYRWNKGSEKVDTRVKYVPATNRKGFTMAPNNYSNTRNLNIHVTLPRTEWIYGNNLSRARSVKITRNGPNSPWRLVNKILANKFNLKVTAANRMGGILGGELVVKNKKHASRF
jgi:hypothetical protein